MKNFVPDRFALVQMLRNDAYATTFIANDLLLDREHVTVKILKNVLTDNRGHLIHDVSWLIGTRHSQFATVCDVGLLQHRYLYYVRDCLPSSDLLDADPIAIMRCIVSAVDFLRSHRRVHGAIKPRNIFVTN